MSCVNCFLFIPSLFFFLLFFLSFSFPSFRSPFLPFVLLFFLSFSFSSFLSSLLFFSLIIPSFNPSHSPFSHSLLLPRLLSLSSLPYTNLTIISSNIISFQAINTDTIAPYSPTSGGGRVSTNINIVTHALKVMQRSNSPCGGPDLPEGTMQV